MNAMNEGRLITFSVVTAIAALGVGSLAVALGAPGWLSTVLAIGVTVPLTLGARYAETRRWGFERRYWTGQQGLTSIEVIFDERLVFLNRVSLLVDGRQVDHTTIWYGTKELHGDGVTVVVGSGWIGECTGVQVRDGTGATAALVERD